MKKNENIIKNKDGTFSIKDDERKKNPVKYKTRKAVETAYKKLNPRNK